MLKRREFLTSICGLGIAALAPWALFAGSSLVDTTPWKTWHIRAMVGDNVVTGTTITPFDYDLHRFGDFDGFGDGLWGEA
ncbi:hypothetical protein LCGC14_1762650 [marine sediment metagenome]|uniref:Uncharacterized protein n=1 Tax=marine sediment metagenome TaxID=412755 RepID=A0A0F9K072_9ZZZZ